MRDSKARLLAAVTLSFVLIAGCARTHKVVPAAKVESADHVFYALPRTVVTASVVVSVTEVERDPRCKDHPAIEELDLDRPNLVGGRFFSLTKGTLTKRAEPDPSERYAVELAGTGSHNLGVSLNARGALAKGSSESTDVIVPLAVGVSEFAAAIAGQVIMPMGIMGPGFGFDGRIDADDADDARYCRTAYERLTAALSALDELYARGSAADPKDVLDYKAAKLTTLAKFLEAPFTGVKPGAPKTITCEIRPAPPASCPDPAAGGSTSPECARKTKLGIDRGASLDGLFTWTQTGGVDPASAPLCDIPAGLTLNDNELAVIVDETTDPKLTAEQRTTKLARLTTGLTTEHEIALVVDPSEDDLAQVSIPAAGGERSFYYRIPAIATAELADLAGGSPSRKSDRVEWEVPQFGKVHSLPRVCSTGSTKVGVTLDPETGALLELSASSTEADLGARLSSLGTTAAGVFEARRSAQSDDELEELQREQAILEARVAIQTAKEALGEE